VRGVPRAPTTVERPDGLEYRPDFMTEDEESGVLAAIDAIEFREVKMRGQTARRTVRHFGYDYDYESWGLVPAEPLPSSLAWLRERCADFAEVASEELVQTLVSRYPPGATIGWHRDAPMFGSKVVGVSLLSGCRMRFQRSAAGIRRVYELELAPRSAYVLGGDARSAWQHSIAPTKSLRYSLTFRTVKNPSRWLPQQETG
jgi:alkylated DNA repair protein (DNA oxidative demethylase)